MKYANTKPIVDQEVHRLGAQTRSLPPQLQSLVSHWLQKCGGRPMPAQGDMPVQELRPWLGHLALIEATRDNDYRVRLFGTNLIRRFGREATGAAIGQLAFDIAKQLRSVMKETAKAAAPVVAISQVQLGRATSVYCEVALPLTGATGRMAVVLLGCYPLQEG